MSRSTLADYSRVFGWQERIQLLDAQDEQEAGNARDVVEEMNRRQAVIGRKMLDVAGKGLQRLQEAGADLGAFEVARLARDGQHIERLAMGESTARVEIALQIYGELATRIEALFVSVNALPDPVERDRRFRIGFDSLIEAHAAGAEPDLRAIEDEPTEDEE